ncbi:MAG: superoxide dismutase [Gammaproteobacteria bacterium]|nr:superoxide dismutase [Gammaproteobacteria bacterium]
MNRCFISDRACLVLTLIISFGAWTSATAQSFPETIPLPDGFQTEGITLGNGHTAYVGSLNGGSIYEVDLRTGAYGEFVPGKEAGQGIPGLPSQIAVGLDFDPRSGYLFVAGGIYGDGRIYDTETGDLVGLPLPPLGMPGVSWINDVVVTQNAAYFTDSFLPKIYKVSLTSEGTPSGARETLELGGEWGQVPGSMIINANGIVATPDGRMLIVVNYITGRLFTVDPDTGFATGIDLGAVSVLAGDGLVLRGKTLYVVQNFLPGSFEGNQISVFRLSPDYTAATLTRVLTHDDPFIPFVPSTADLFGPWLYVVNARFDACFPTLGCPPETKFEIVRVDQK